MKIRKICYITGTRADFGLMCSTLKKISENFELSLIVTGMHLSREFGYTVDEIERSGFTISKRVDMLLSGDTGGAMAKSLGMAIYGISQALEDDTPDLVLLLGDRGEALAAAISAAHLNIPIAHVHGGDQGDDGAHIDDQIRHSITKFSHIHLAATEQSGERISKMGEEQWRIFTVGAPGLDEIYSAELFSRSDLNEKYGLNFDEPLILMVQHPVLTQTNKAGTQIRETLEALQELQYQTVLIYPNSDAGGREMIQVIKEYEGTPFLHTFRSIPRKDYLSIMKFSDVMVGNSSSGTIEAPVFHLPVVNVGIRESTREHAGNKIFVNPERNEIRRSIEKALSDQDFKHKIRQSKSPYGDGTASLKIVEVIKNITKYDKNELLTKKLTY